MQNLCFFISSAINLDDSNHLKFSYSKQRSAFNAEERFRQTQFTINSIRLIAPEAPIFLLDISENFDTYIKRLSYVKNFVFIPLQALAPEIAYQCRTSSAKGYCESLSTQWFIENFYDAIQNYSYVCKISGRYFYTKFNFDHFTQDNQDRYLIKPAHNFAWLDRWQFPEKLKIDNRLRYAFTCTYAVGNNKFQHWKDNMHRVSSFYLESDAHFVVDFESAIAHYVMTKDNCAETWWYVAGWGGANGDFGTWDQWFP